MRAKKPLVFHLTADKLSFQVENKWLNEQWNGMAGPFCGYNLQQDFLSSILRAKLGIPQHKIEKIVTIFQSTTLRYRNSPGMCQALTIRWLQLSSVDRGS